MKINIKSDSAVNGIWKFIEVTSYKLHNHWIEILFNDKSCVVIPKEVIKRVDIIGENANSSENEIDTDGIRIGTYADTHPVL